MLNKPNGINRPGPLALAAALNALPLKLRKIYLLHDLRGKPVSYIARVVGVSPREVTARLATARQLMPLLLLEVEKARREFYCRPILPSDCDHAFNE